MSPLLLTIILIALAVALGAMIMSWGSNKVYPTKASCDSVELVTQQAFGTDLICFNEETGKLKIVVKNSGKSALSAIVYRKISPDMTVRDILLPSSELEVGKIYEAEIPHVKGEKAHLEIIPQIKNGEEILLCDDKAIVKENIPSCSSSQ